MQQYRGRRMGFEKVPDTSLSCQKLEGLTASFQSFPVYVSRYKWARAQQCLFSAKGVILRRIRSEAFCQSLATAAIRWRSTPVYGHTGGVQISADAGFASSMPSGNANIDTILLHDKT
jgi:hypothetical protein